MACALQCLGPLYFKLCYAASRHLDSDGDGSLSVGELKQALGDLGFGQRAQAAAEDMVQEAAGQGVGRIVLADFLQFLRRVCCLTAITRCFGPVHMPPVP